MQAKIKETFPPIFLLKYQECTIKTLPSGLGYLLQNWPFRKKCHGIMTSQPTGCLRTALCKSTSINSELQKPHLDD